jgi:hypothetical protein
VTLRGGAIPQSLDTAGLLYKLEYLHDFRNLLGFRYYGYE